MQAEHLIAIMLQTGRLKDHARIEQFVELDVLDQKQLDSILARHELIKQWEALTRRKVK